MKMVMVVIPSNTAEDVLDALIQAGHTATYAETSGGMLRQSQHSLFIAVKKEQLDEIKQIIQDNCRTKVQMNTCISDESEGTRKQSSYTTDLGGAIAFIWDLDSVETF